MFSTHIRGGTEDVCVQYLLTKQDVSPGEVGVRFTDIPSAFEVVCEGFIAQSNGDDGRCKAEAKVIREVGGVCNAVVSCQCLWMAVGCTTHGSSGRAFNLVRRTRTKICCSNLNRSTSLYRIARNAAGREPIYAKPRAWAASCTRSRSCLKMVFPVAQRFERKSLMSSHISAFLGSRTVLSSNSGTVFFFKNYRIAVSKARGPDSDQSTSNLPLGPSPYAPAAAASP